MRGFAGCKAGSFRLFFSIGKPAAGGMRKGSLDGRSRRSIRPRGTFALAEFCELLFFLTPARRSRCAEELAGTHP